MGGRHPDMVLIRACVSPLGISDCAAIAGEEWMYRGRLKRDLERWVERGLIDAETAHRLLDDVDTRGRSYSLGTVLAMCAVALIAAAILMLVAANWDQVPRTLRVGGIILQIWLYHSVALIAHHKGYGRVSAAALLLGATAFGAGIQLIGQMYHLSGDSITAMLVWFSVTAVSAFLLRSPALAVMAGILSIATWLVGTWTGDFEWKPAGLLSHWQPVAAIVVGAASAWTGADRAKHLAYWLFIAWIWWLVLESGIDVATLILTVIAIVLFVALTLHGSPLAKHERRLGASPAFYSCLVAMMGLAKYQLEANGPLSIALTGCLLIGFCLVAIILKGRDNTAIRYLAYAAFVADVLYLANETIGSLLGTSAFFLLSGLVVAVVAFIVVRLERRLSTTVAEVRS
jgi:uncharacterized membrane protein